MTKLKNDIFRGVLTDFSDSDSDSDSESEMAMGSVVVDDRSSSMLQLCGEKVAHHWQKLPSALT